MNLFSKLFRSRDKPKDYLSVHWPFLFGSTTAGRNVNERTSMQVTAVYACVRILSEAIASLPLNVYQYGAEGSKEKLYSHPLYHLLHDEPNPEMTSFIFRETMMSHLLLWGNAYAQIIRNGKGEVVGLYPLLPNKMDVSRNKAGRLIYTYRRNADEAGSKKRDEEVVLKREDVLHIPGLGFDGLIGYSPIAMAKNAIGIAIATEEYGATFFANGATPGGILEHPGVVKDPEKLRQSWKSQFSGKNSHSVAVLEEGMTFKQMAIPPNEAQFLETRKFQINEIARIFRVPPHMVGDLEKSSFSNIEQQSLDFVMYTLNPWIVRWEQAIRGVLRPAFQMAADDDLIRKNPFQFPLVDVIVNDSVRREALTRDNERKFLKFVKEDRHFSKFYEGIYILFKTGMRISEFCGLTIRDINFRKHTINIDHQLMKKGSTGYYIQKTKTESGNRVIPMTPDVEECFRKIIANRKAPKVEPMVDGHTGFLYFDKDGHIVYSLHWEHYFQRIVQKYNSIYKVEMPKVTPHICRHTYCSNMAKSGMNPKTLQYLMGHSEIGVTLNVYTHVDFDDAKTEVERISTL